MNLNHQLVQNLVKKIEKKFIFIKIRADLKHYEKKMRNFLDKAGSGRLIFYP